MADIPDGKRPLVRSRYRWDNNIKMNHSEVGWEGVDWINLAWERCKWRTVVKTVVNLPVAQNARNSFYCQKDVTLPEGLCSMD